jgi:hypothetical protein
LATLRCIIQINDPNIVIDFPRKGSLYKLLGYEKKQNSIPYNEGKNTVKITCWKKCFIEPPLEREFPILNPHLLCKNWWKIFGKRKV